MNAGWLINHQRAFGQALQRLLHAPIATLFTLLVMGLAISLPALLYLATKNVDQWLGNLPVTPEISVFTQTDDRQALQQMESQLRAQPEVASVRLIRREEAIKALSERLGVSDLASGLPQNPLAHTWIIRLKDNAAADIHAQLQQSLARLPNVAAVQYDAVLNSKLQALRSFSRNAAWALAALLAIALASVIGNTIRLQILTQRDEIEVSILIGATSAFIRRPFMYFGLLQGVLGGLMALLLLALLSSLTTPYLTELLQSYGSHLNLQSLNMKEALLVLLAPAILGGISAQLAASHHLRTMRPY